jgi:hypothetical protein
MNKEDRKDHVLTFPAFLAEFIMLTAQGFVMLLGKNEVSFLTIRSSSAA